MKTVVWTTSVPVERTAQGLSSPLASARYRVIIPSAGLAQCGWSSRVTHIALTANRATLLKRFEGASAAVLGKLAYTDDRDFAQAAPRWLELAAQLRSAGVKIIADFSDDRTADLLRGAFDRQLADIADTLVASTPELAEVLRSVSSTPVRVITDPVEGARGAPHESIPGPVRLLWFGHWNKLRDLPAALSQLDRATTPFSLLLVTAPGLGAERITEDLDAKWRKAGSSCWFRPWSVSTVFEELAHCDAVIIPSAFRPDDVVRSPNRFTESVWAGRFAIAHPLPAYKALADFGWVGEDLNDGLSWFVANPVEVKARILAGQGYIAEHYAPAAIARAWEQAISDTLG